MFLHELLTQTQDVVLKLKIQYRPANCSSGAIRPLMAPDGPQRPPTAPNGPQRPSTAPDGPDGFLRIFNQKNDILISFFG